MLHSFFPKFNFLLKHCAPSFKQGMAVVAARATRLPIYSSFAKEGNLSDLFAKGEAISTLFNVVGLGAGIQLASTVCSTVQGKVYNLHQQLTSDLFSLLYFQCVQRMDEEINVCVNLSLTRKYRD